MKATTISYEVDTVEVDTTALCCAELVVVHILLAVLATRAVTNRRKNGLGTSEVHLFSIWLVPIVGPAIALWKFRPAPQPPLL